VIVADGRVVVDPGDVEPDHGDAFGGPPRAERPSRAPRRVLRQRIRRAPREPRGRRPMEPSMPPPHTTRILLDATDGDESAASKLVPLIYDKLHELAGGYLRRERSGHTLSPTALTHEAYLRLVDQEKTDWRSRTHFFAVAANQMRRVLLDHARRHAPAKRGGGARRVALDPAQLAADDRGLDLIDLDEGLAKLRELDARQADVVQLRFYGGLGLEEIAQHLGVSSRTVWEDWRMARAWLRRHLRESHES